MMIKLTENDFINGHVFLKECKNFYSKIEGSEFEKMEKFAMIIQDFISTKECDLIKVFIDSINM